MKFLTSLSLATSVFGAKMDFDDNLDLGLGLGRFQWDAPTGFAAYIDALITRDGIITSDEMKKFLGPEPSYGADRDIY